jgi:site-specific recombinase XerD
MKDSIKNFLLFLEGKNSSIHTLRAYQKSLNEFSAHVGNLPVNELTRQHVRSFIRYLSERGLKRTSTHRMVASVKSFVKWLHVEDLIPLDIGHGVTTPRLHHHLTDPPSQAEIRILLDGELKTPFPERDRALLELLYATGIRNSEACGIMPEDFEPPDVLIVRGKGNVERRVIYGGRARAALDAYRPKRAEMLASRSFTDLVKPAFFLSFGPNVGLQGLNVRSVGRILKQAAAVKGLDPKKYHPHLLRHCFSTHCHDNGMPVEVINKLLGHAKLSTTVTYLQVSTNRMMTSYNRAHPHAKAPA